MEIKVFGCEIKNTHHRIDPPQPNIPCLRQQILTVQPGEPLFIAQGSLPIRTQIARLYSLSCSSRIFVMEGNAAKNTAIDEITMNKTQLSLPKLGAIVTLLQERTDGQAAQVIIENRSRDLPIVVTNGAIIRPGDISQTHASKPIHAELDMAGESDQKGRLRVDIYDSIFSRIDIDVVGYYKDEEAARKAFASKVSDDGAGDGAGTAQMISPVARGEPRIGSLFFRDKQLLFHAAEWGKGKMQTFGNPDDRDESVIYVGRNYQGDDAFPKGPVKGESFVSRKQLSLRVFPPDYANPLVRSIEFCQEGTSSPTRISIQ